MKFRSDFGFLENCLYMDKLVIIKMRSLSQPISIPGSLSFAKLVMMSSIPAKSPGDTRYASQDPFIQSTFPTTVLTPI